MHPHELLTLTVLDLSAGPKSRTVGSLRNGTPLVLDLWHTKCVKCPAALSKLDSIAAKHPDVKFVACALSLCDKSEGPSDEERSREAVVELVDDMWENLTHCYMTVEEKLKAKAELGFTSVPFCLVIAADGSILFKGDPAQVDYTNVFNTSPPPDSVPGDIKVAEPSLLKPLSESNHISGKPALGFGYDDEDF